MKIPNKKELLQIEINHSSDIESKDFMNNYKKCTVEPYSFSVNNMTLLLNNFLLFSQNL